MEQGNHLTMKPFFKRKLNCHNYKESFSVGISVKKTNSMRYIFILLFFTNSFIAFAQDETPKTETQPIKTEIQLLEDTMNILGFAIVNDSTPEKRFAACRKFIPTLVNALKTKNSFDYPFKKLNTISIQYSPDSTFRIFTWQLYVDINDYKYYGTIQMNQPELKMFPLIDRSEEIEEPKWDELSTKNWYGSLIYNIKEFETAEGAKQYFLFGFDGYRFFSKRKFIDVMTFNEKNEPTFGAIPVFEAEDSTNVNRFILEYGSDARVQLNWNDELNMIMFDHLVEAPSPYPGQEYMYIPDGDTDGLKLEDGKWKYIRRVFDQVLDEAPRPEPIFNEKGGRKDRKNIFGKRTN